MNDMNARQILAKAENKENLNLLRGDFTSLSYTGAQDNPLGVIISKQEELETLVIPKAWTNLVYLNLCDNPKLSRVIFEQALPNLVHLDISDSQLEALDLPIGFEALKDVYLQGNKLSALRLQGDFPSLHLLDLSKNLALSAIPENLYRFGNLQYVYTYESPIFLGEENLAKQAGNAWQRIKAYLSEFGEGKKKNYRTKMIIVGNGRVGKTSMLKVLQGKDYDPKEAYTHGIQLGEIKKEELAEITAEDFYLQVWDFGGQEIFYATHQFFMTDNALYVLAWTCAKNVAAYQQEMQSKNEAVDCGEKWRAEQNWLENIRAYTKQAPIIMVQTHYDIKENRLAVEGVFREIPYMVEPYDFSAAKKLGLEGLKYLISEKLQELPSFGKEYPRTYDKVIQAFQKEKAPVINQKRYLEICEQAGIKKGNEVELLRYLNNTGTCVHYPDKKELSDKIFIDPAWLTQCVYALLNKELKSVEGKMEEAYIQNKLYKLKAEKDIAITQKELIALLKSFQLIFETEEREEGTNRLQKIFIYPEYLPEVLSRESLKFYRQVKAKLKKAFSLKYLNYLPENVLINIICHYGPDTTNDVVWKNGIYFTTAQEETAIIEFDPEMQYFSVYTEDGDAAENLQREICHKFEELGRNTAMEIALDVEKGFIAWRKLKNDRILADFCASDDPANFEIRNEAGKAFRYGDWVFLASPQMFHRKQQKAKIAAPEKTSAKIYFSYAWGDDKEEGASREEIVKRLYDSLKEEDFEVRRDKEDLVYGESLNQFMKEIGEGDLILVFASEKYFKSPNCMFELMEIGRNSKWDKEEFTRKILPIPVRFIDFTKPTVLDEYFTYWEEQEEKWSKLVKKRADKIKPAQFNRYDKIRSIHQNFGNLSDWIVDMNQGSKLELSKNNFEEVKKAILKRLKRLAQN